MSGDHHPGGLASLKAKALAEDVPLIAHLELTHRCGWRCVFCCNPPANGHRELNLGEWRQVLSDLRQLGTLYVTLTGGDPLIRPDFFDIASSARHLGFALRVFTNGSVIDDCAANNLAGLCCLSVELSVHGATAETHDAITGRRGSFLQLWRAVDLLQTHEVPVMLKCPVTRRNEDELTAIVDRAEHLGIPCRLDPTIVVGDDGNRVPLSWRASNAGVQKTFELLAAHGALPVARYDTDEPICGVGANTVAVDPQGSVFPCIQWRHESLGNVCTVGLRDLWERSAVRRRAALVARRAGTMLADRQDASSRYPFCPAVAAREHDDPLGIGPFQRRQAEAADALRRT